MSAAPDMVILSEGAFAAVILIAYVAGMVVGLICAMREGGQKK